MTSNDTQVTHVLAHHFSSSLSYITVGSAVETITAQTVFYIHFVGQTIKECSFRHGLVERSIKYCNLRNFRHKFHTSVDTMQVRRIVERCDFAARFNTSDNIRVDEHTISKAFAAMYYAMTYRVDFTHLFDYAMVLISKSINNQLNGNFMVRNFSINFNSFLAAGGVF